ncbi:MAG: FAD-dependent oxidoreductase [Deltaproteobacteria bacterium]|nr:FAD-dependent oxidoreductase [Deltaproteobacteria bacterium]
MKTSARQIKKDAGKRSFIKRTTARAGVATAVSKKWSFEIPPPLTPQKQIKEVITTDVVVVGAGLAGLTAAGSAAEKGTETILLEKGSGASFRGFAIAAVNNRAQKEAGIEINRDKVIAELMTWSGYWADQKVVTLWADNSADVVDWLTDLALAAGITPNKLSEIPQTIPGSFYNWTPVIGVNLPGWNKTVADLLERNATKHGVDIRWNTVAEQLIRKGKGRVTGVIAQTSAGNQIQFNASKAVILCTGDYGHNPEMVRKYIAPRASHFGDIFYGFDNEFSRNPEVLKKYIGPGALPIPDHLKAPHKNTGDGHKMGLWIGAAIDEPPHCPMLFDHAVIESPIPIFVPLTRQPFLNVNLDGERFKNEELPFAYICNADQAQPGHMKWVVWDAKWEEEGKRMAEPGCKALIPPLHNPLIIQVLIEKGIIKSAATLEELVQKMQVPAETFKATVARYNELAKLGKDFDFGKRPECLTTIEKAPFFAIKMGVSLLVTLGGLKVNTKLQVLDTEMNVIPGLYAAGNASGSFFSNDYPITIFGVSHSRALTFGRLAGFNAAAEQV